jgi:hypothetical protein
MKIRKIAQVSDKELDIYVSQYNKSFPVKVVEGEWNRIGYSTADIRWDEVYLNEILIGKIKHLRGKPRKQPILTVDINEEYVEGINLEWLVSNAVERMQNIISSGYMKIRKISQAQQMPIPDQQGAQPIAPQQQGQQIQQVMDPRIRKVFMQSLVGTGLSKQKVLPFLEQLFTGLGDVPLSKVTGLLKALQNDPEVL